MVGGGGSKHNPHPPPPPRPIALPGVIVFLMNARAEGGCYRWWWGVISQPFVQFCGLLFVLCFQFLLIFPPWIPASSKKEKGTALFDADVEEVAGSKVS